jgi:hypothetical protein
MGQMYSEKEFVNNFFAFVLLSEQATHVKCALGNAKSLNALA